MIRWYTINPWIELQRRRESQYTVFDWTKVHEKCQKWSTWRVFETWSLQSNSVTRQFTFNRTKWWKMPKFECDILSIFKHCECYSLRSCKEVTMTQFVATFPTVQRLIFFFTSFRMFLRPPDVCTLLSAPLNWGRPIFRGMLERSTNLLLCEIPPEKPSTLLQPQKFFHHCRSNNFIVSEVCKTSFRRR